MKELIKKARIWGERGGSLYHAICKLDNTEYAKIHKEMEKVYISEIGKYENKEITLKGWLYNKRSSGKLRFLLVRDGTETIQCVVFKNDVSEEDFRVVAEFVTVLK